MSSPQTPYPGLERSNGTGEDPNRSRGDEAGNARLTARKRRRARIARVSVAVFTFLAVLEIALRASPSSISRHALVFFEPGLRSAVATGRLPTREDTVILKRDDGGPELPVWKPFTKRNYSFKDLGTVSIVQADEIGFSNPGGSYAGETIEIIGIGDSFTWAHAVRPEDSWPVRLGQLMGASAYNLGKGNTGPYEQIQILKHFGLCKKPRIVVMNMYEGNDLRDAVRYHEYRQGKPLDDENGEMRWQRTWPGRHSYAFNLLCAGAVYIMKEVREKRAGTDRDFRYSVHTEDGDVPFNAEQGGMDEVTYPCRQDRGEISFSVFDEALKAFAALGVERGFTPVVAYTPSAYVVYAPVKFRDSELREILPRFSSAQREYLARRARELGLIFVDLTDALRKAAFPAREKDLLYYPTSLHYTARGHDVVAHALADILPGLASAH